ncbi:hypothetical protein GDO86_019277 [Hymenochirus boettgeri]|uniref:G-protein coupled receptors family 1 profile domain-containing protein n=1 Tax=Hymenochirus boettgeri TaxID=247094 RepID=A0A8T2IJD6_9PIPI|nr:hypothetical protein GDO86_019277 [Hymenochirus boettgeri]
MYKKNQTFSNEIFLLGFQNLQNFKIPLFSLFQVIYLLTICENIFIIVLVSTSHNLQSPMYFFLQHLSMCDLVETNTIVPIMLKTITQDGVKLPLIGCITQLSFFGSSEAFQCLLLSVMSFDRYLAICNPLRYITIMNRRVCVQLTLIPFLLSFVIIPCFTLAPISTLQFCEQNTIDHFFCDFIPLLELSCSDASFVQHNVIYLSVPVVMFPFMFIVLSYIYIVRSILQITSSIGRQKAFSTCSSHLAVVSMFYGTITGVYVIPSRKHLLTINKVLSLLYTVVIPFLNPVIYTLRNKDIKDALKTLLGNPSINTLNQYKGLRSTG